MKTTVSVKQDEQKPVAVEVLAASIVAIADGMKKLRAGPLNERCLLILIQHAAPHNGGRYGNGKISTKQIRAVLDSVEALKSTYLRKPTP